MKYKKQIEIDRANKDRYFKTSHHSPIPHELRDDFFSLEYYSIAENYRFELTLNSYESPEIIEMEESTGSVSNYLRIGYLEFKINEEEVEIHVYQSTDNPDIYFVPFRDKTSGEDSYGAGRYLYPEKKGDIFVLDFNLAMSPYCAYSENYACPLPPYENWLKVRIEAGEKNFPLAIH